MKPEINRTSFGSITIDNQKITNDVLIRLDSSINKRKKKLSKAIYGTSHKISLDEAKYIFEPGTEKLILGTGQFDRLRLSDEAKSFFKDNGVEVFLKSTSSAIKLWNETQGAIIGLFHITC